MHHYCRGRSTFADTRDSPPPHLLTPGASLSRLGDVDAALLSARNGLGAERYPAYHEFTQPRLQAHVVYVDTYDVP